MSAQGEGLVELTRRSMEATNRHDLGAAMFARDAVFDVSAAGVGRFEGREAVHRYLEDWLGSYSEQRMTGWEGTQLGERVVFVVTEFDSRPLGSSARVRERWGFVVRWEEGEIVQVIADPDLAAARAAAERLAAG
jgi:ketosteroid isomerase-like protein